MRDKALLHAMFICPLCGSHYWGTSFMRNGKIVKSIERAYGQCNGWLVGDDGRTARCDFVWNRSDDAWIMSPRPDTV